MAVQVYAWPTDSMLCVIIKANYPYCQPGARVHFSVDGNPVILH